MEENGGKLKVDVAVIQNEINALQSQITNIRQEDIKPLFAHAEIANKEMGDIKIDIALIKQKIGNINKVQWLILTIIITTALATFFLRK
jgi:hypothetical protein